MRKEEDRRRGERAVRDENRTHHLAGRIPTFAVSHHTLHFVVFWVSVG
jgi:hypothetical protein